MTVSYLNPMYRLLRKISNRSIVQFSCVFFRDEVYKSHKSRITACLPAQMTWFLTIMNSGLEICDWKMWWPVCDPGEGEQALNFSDWFCISDPLSSQILQMFFLSLWWLFDMLNDQHLKSLFLRNRRSHAFASSLLFCLCVLLNEVFLLALLNTACGWPFRDAVAIKLRLTTRVRPCAWSLIAQGRVLTQMLLTSIVGF